MFIKVLFYECNGEQVFECETVCLKLGPEFSVTLLLNFVINYHAVDSEIERDDVFLYEYHPMECTTINKYFG